MAPPQAIPIFGQMEDTPVQVSYLWIPGGCHICARAAGLTSIMAKEVTRIVALYWPPSIYLSSTRIMAPPQAIPILCQIEYTSVNVSYLWFPGGCHICPRAAGLTSIIALEVTRIVALEVTRIVALFCPPPGVYLSLTRIMAHPQATPILCQMTSIYLFKSPIFYFLVVTMTSILT